MFAGCDGRMGTNFLRLRWRRRDRSDSVTPHENRSLQLIINIGIMWNNNKIIARGFRYKYRVFHNDCQKLFHAGGSII